MITHAILRAAIHGVNQANAERFAVPISDACREFSINTTARIAAFLAQVGHESGNLSRVVESLNYSVEALVPTFGRHRITEEQGRQFGRNDATGQKAAQEAIANTVYGGEWGRKNLGNTEPGDGWRYRGRGLIQLTGRANQTACLAVLGETDPDYLLTPEGAARSAAWFWASRGLNALADRGDIEAITRAINGGKIGLAERKQHYAHALAALGVPAPTAHA